MTITPSQARDLLNGTTPTPWKKTQDGLTHPTGYTIDGVLHDCCDYQGVVDDPNADLICAAPDMAHQIANMAWEYAAQVQLSPGTPWQYLTSRDLFTDLPHLARWRRVESEATPSEYAQLKYPTRVVRRLVTTPEVIE